MDLTAYLVTSLRIVTIIPFVLLMTLLMGKRQVGELPVFDFIVAITLGSVVGADIADPSIDHGPTVWAILLLAILQVAYSYATLFSLKLRRYTRFEPTIVIQNGVILRDNLKKIRYSLDQLLELLRLKGVFSLEEVEFALVEANGKVSVLKKTQYDSLKPKDMKLDTPYQGLPTPIIYEGKVDEEMLAQTKLDKQWLKDKLTQLNIESSSDVFYAELDTQGELYVSPMSPQVAEDKRIL